MDLRTVLVLTYHFPPSSASGSFRLLGFARHLPKFGWRAAVVAPPSMPWEGVDPALAAQVPPETAIYHVPYLKSRVTRKLAHMWGWLGPASGAMRRAIREQRPDAVLTSGPPHAIHWLGWWAKRHHGVPWVADFRDPWYPEGRMERGRDLASRRAAIQEGVVMRSADLVLANAPMARKTLVDAYPQLAEKFATLTNGYDREAFDAAPPPPPRDGRPLRLVHAGAIYVGRDPRPVLDAVKTLADGGQANLHASFFGPPAETGLNLNDEVARRGLQERVQVSGPVPYARSLGEMASADILLLMDTPGRTVGVPAKLYEYLGAGRPVLTLGERGGDLEAVLSESGLAHRIVKPGDVEGVTRALGELAAEVNAGETDHRGREFHHFSRESIAGRLAEFLDDCAARSARASAKGQGGMAPRDTRPPSALAVGRD